MHYFKMTCIYIFSISIVLFILNIINYVLINVTRSSCFTVLGVGDCECRKTFHKLSRAKVKCTCQGGDGGAE